MKNSILTILVLLAALTVRADNGYDLWLNYKPSNHAKQYKAHTIHVCDNKHKVQIEEELFRAVGTMTGVTPKFVSAGRGADLVFELDKNSLLSEEGYSIRSEKNTVRVTAKNSAGLLYGAFHVIRIIQCGESLADLAIEENPKIGIRLLKHWDRLDGSVIWIDVEGSIWKWDELPARVDVRYTDYARANASVGINAMCIMINDPEMMTPGYLGKLAAIAKVMDSYNLKIFMAVNFTAPMSPEKVSNKNQKYSAGIGDLDTADPCDERVAQWWKEKVAEIYGYIPNLGGFIVKANSEGMPGPLDYDRSYADGANVIARALKPYNGIVLWRTFVYNNWVDNDRAKRPYKEFIGLDGRFDDNVVLLTKNGPIDFQPCEPVHPLFGGMTRTQVMPELQIMQEYLGHETYAVYLLSMWREFLNFDTYCKGKGSRVGEIIEGKVFPYSITVMAGVSNMGKATNWTSNHFAQANWYAFGRLTWNPQCDDDAITDEWIKMTWNCDGEALSVIKAIMQGSWKAYAAANSPYGMGITSSPKDHYTPAFEHRNGRTWRADASGIGESRSASGSDYVSQYHSPNREIFDNPATCPEELLLFFHFAPWDYKLKSGKVLKDDIDDKLRAMVDYTEQAVGRWKSIESTIDPQRYREVLEKLNKQLEHAREYYRNGSTYFERYSDGVTPNSSLKLLVK